MVKENKPLVSILTLTYNHEKYIDEFMDSVFSQTYSNWELIIGDDASTDKTQEKLISYQKKYPNKVKLILNKKNIGITKNANNILKLASGKYITTIAGDDLLHPNKLEEQVYVMEENKNITLTFHDVEVIYENKENSILFSQVNYKFPRKGGLKEIIKYGMFLSACSVMIRANSIPKHGFDYRLPIASDWLFFVESIGKEGKFLYIDKVLGKYRRHGSNITSLRPIEGLNDHILACGILLGKYPEFASEIKYRLSQILTDKSVLYLKRGDKANFLKNIKASLKYKKNFRNTFLYLSQILGIDFDYIYKLKNKFKKSI